MTTNADAITKIEPITQKQIDALIRAIGYLGAMVCRLGDVDLTKGRGVLANNDGSQRHCLWTTDQRRITVTFDSYGGVVASVGKEPDPQCPKPPETEKKT